jgi:6,7-dimethyl-8-ribityllumazine synthase
MATDNSQLFQPNTGIGSTSDACIVLVKTDWNASFTDELEKGARRILALEGVKQIQTLLVPGAVEIPFAIQQFHLRSASVRPDAYIALGCVIKGDTPHFDYVASEVSKGVAQVGLDTGIPCIFGVLTTDTIEQAIERAGTKAGNKGAESAVAAIEMISLMKKLA